MSLIRRRMMMAKEPDITDTPTEELDYLTIVPLHDSVEEYLIYPYSGSNDVLGGVYTQDMPFYYRINGGEWIEVNLPDSENLVFRINLSKGSEMQLKCMGCNFSFSYGFDVRFFRINSSANHAVKGTPMSLWYGDDFKSANSTLMDESSLLFLDDIGLTAILNPKTFLPCTNLDYGCYAGMFSGCRNLLHAPELPATTLAVSCYFYMFQGCTKLNYIKMLATDISAIECLDNWVYNVSPTGTFVKSKDATWDTTPGALGTSGVPAGWTVITEEEEGESPYAFSFNIEAEGASWTANAQQLVQINKMFAIVTKFLGMDGGEFNQDNAPQEFDLRLNGVRNFSFQYSGIENESDLIDVFFGFDDGNGVWFGQRTFPWNSPIVEQFSLYKA